MSDNHELHTFLRQVSEEMRSEYERIYKRTREDPGTAGDEGEANWARLLKDWLPADIHVETKGRILAADGSASPQLDVVILAGDYPRKLRDKKLYLAGGVLAAFECKNTLRKPHLSKLFSTAKAISRMAPGRKGNFYGESFSPITYGLLAHSHEWTPDNTADSIDREIARLHGTAAHPRDIPAVISVSDLHTWEHSLSPLMPLAPEPDWKKDALISAGAGKWSYFIESNYMRWRPLPWSYAPGEGPQISKERPNPIGELLLCLLCHLGQRGFDRAGMADYYRKAHLSGGGSVGFQSDIGIRQRSIAT
ncbi:DUF6602 domain-containing protein [Actinomycetes bacterium NPDC127524]|uniref:DUF6602 domain-containing protein n=1 Tax=Streptomyces niveus TaxID=193462 RepID=UPI0034246869